ELTKILLAYRSTPHCVIGKTPAFLMFGRELKTKLPGFRPDGDIHTESISEKDWERKLQDKTLADKRRGAVEKQLEVGDAVLVKNTMSSGKLTAAYESTPYVILGSDNQEVTLE
ncbi:hypothetical protein CAPTEDRAFT_27554, partial [Capitella teleta]